MKQVLATPGGMDGIEPMVEREFMASLRPRMLAACGWKGGRAGTLELETMAEALAPLTLLERQIVWFETMSYNLDDTARLTRVSVDTARKARERAGELLRGRLDSWTQTIIADNGGLLSDQAGATKPAEPVAFRHFLDIIDGRMTWQLRAEVEPKIESSWFEIDHFCRIREADAAVRDTKPLQPEEAAGYLSDMGVRQPRVSLWKRLLGG